MIRIISLLLLIFFIFLNSNFSYAAVREATFFPNAAQITESVKINPQCSGKDKCRAAILLPPQADPESFRVSIPPGNRFKIDDVQIKSITRRDEARIAELRKQIEKLKIDRKELQARMQALDAQLQFWQMQTKTNPKNLTDADNLVTAIGKNVKKTSQDKFAVENDMEKTDKQLKELQDDLNRATGSKETAWEAVLTFSTASLAEITFSYTYNMGECGWRPLYRIEALPGENKVDFSWEAELWQSSGFDWKQAQINLATLQPSVTVAPPDLPEWIIKKRTRRIYKSLREEAIMPRASMEKKSLDIEEDQDQNAAPEETHRTTYSVWSIGKKDIPAGQRQRVRIKEEHWPADFFYLARPALSPQAFLCTQIKFANAVEIPPGEAVILIDGAILGKHNFQFNGTERTLFFGSSPLISVTSSTITDKAGAKTVFQNKQTQLWEWLIEAKNSGGNNVKLRIEEPVPQARDERIKLSFRQNPAPTEKGHEKFVWIIALPARQKTTISNIIEMEAPKDLDLDLGWRR